MCDLWIDHETVVERLMDISGIQPDEFLAAVNIELGARRVAYDPALSSRDNLVRLVKACLYLNGGSTALLNVAKKLYKGSREVDALGRSLSPAIPFLPGEEMQRVLDLLRGVAVENLPHLYHMATEWKRPMYPGGIREVWEVFDYLLDSNIRPGHLPPHLRLCALVLGELERSHSPSAPALRTKLRRWLKRQCDELRDDGQSAAAVQLLFLLQNPPPYSTRNDHPITLIVRIDQLPAPNDEQDMHVVSHWRHIDPLRWHLERQEDRHLPMRDVPAYVLNLVMEAKSGWGYGVGGPLVLEFVLPIELINLEIDRWPMEKYTLGSEHEIVVRGDRRLRPPVSHGSWHDRWDKLHLGTGRTHLIPPGRPFDPAELRNDDLVACVLSTPPDREPGRSELMEAVATRGFPIVVWCRDAEGTGAFRTDLMNFLQQPELRQLPTTVKDFRSSLHSTCGNMVLLWDNPKRGVPDLHFLVTP